MKRKKKTEYRLSTFTGCHVVTKLESIFTWTLKGSWSVLTVLRTRRYSILTFLDIYRKNNYQFIRFILLCSHSFFFLSIGHVCIPFRQSFHHSVCLKQRNVLKFTLSSLFTWAVCVRVTFEPRFARAVKWAWQVCAECILRAVMPHVGIFAFIYFWKVTLTVNPL